MPPVGEQFRNSALRMAADAFEDIAQVGEGIDAEALGCRDETTQHGCGPTAVVAAVERPIAATDGDAAQAALGAGMPTSGLCRHLNRWSRSTDVQA